MVIGELCLNRRFKIDSSVIYCPYCGRVNEPESKKCGVCGTPMEYYLNHNTLYQFHALPAQEAVNRHLVPIKRKSSGMAGSIAFVGFSFFGIMLISIFIAMLK